MATGEPAKSTEVAFRSSSPDERNAGIVERLTAERARIGLKQSEMAELMGISVRTYTAYEAGERFPTLDSLAGLAARGVDLNWIAFGGSRAASEVPAEGMTAETSRLQARVAELEAELAKAGTLPSESRAKDRKMLTGLVAGVLTNLRRTDPNPDPMEVGRAFADVFLQVLAMTEEEIAAQMAQAYVPPARKAG